MENVSRSIHHLQDAVAEHKRKHHYHQSHHHGNTHGIGYVDAHLMVVLRTERLRHRYGEAGAGSVAEAHYEKGDRCRSAYSRQCAHADPSAYDDGVDDEVHLLKDVAQYQGQCEFGDLV